MDLRKERLIKLHEEIFNFLNEYRKADSEFTFDLRFNQSRKSSPENLIKEGFWLHGSLKEGLIRVGLFKPSHKKGLDKTISLNIEVNEQGEIGKNYFYIHKPKELGGTKKEIEFYNELAKKTNITYKVIKGIEGQQGYSDNQLNNYLDNLKDFITKFRKVCIELLQKYKLESEFIITEDEFIKKLKNTEKYRSELILKQNLNQNTESNNPTKDTRPKNIILYGPPGTGKTYNSIDWAVKIANSKSYVEGNHKSNKVIFDELRKNGQIEFVTFHQNYSYEDFMVGIRPNIDNGNGNLSFVKHEGIFYKLADTARKNYQNNLDNDEELKSFVLVIDEINRANISKVFGELITLLEDDKRLGEDEELKITLPNGEKDFGLPPNLFVIGTMNTADKSIALVDLALRRRFEFIGFPPDSGKLANNEAAKKLLEKINDKIYELKSNSADHLIGHAYFMKGEKIDSVIKNKIIPLLMEYFSNKKDFIQDIFKETDWKVTYLKEKFGWDVTKK
jgi:hypothetical protein